MSQGPITVIGGGLAGTEIALVLAKAGVEVTLVEMRPEMPTPAHESGDLGELVCSNSLRSNDPMTAPGLLKEELRLLQSPVVRVADEVRVPAGSALAVDRTLFSRRLTREIEDNPLVRLERREVTRLPEEGFAVLTPGPLASPALLRAVEERVGTSGLFFFDAIAPILDADSLDMDRLFLADRYDKGDPDYLNAAMNREEYFAFLEALTQGEKFVPHGFDSEERLPLFSGCQPIEAIAASGPLSLAHGPMKPKGLTDPRTGRYPFAVVQLRAENVERTSFNLVGFQTRLLQKEQKRVFRLIPGLERAEFLRYGSLHRNSFLDGPRVLNPDLTLRAAPNLMAAGQFAGAEGYIESIALGHLAARFLLARRNGTEPAYPPVETALGGLWRHVTASTTTPLEPSNVHFGLLPAVSAKGKRPKRQAMMERARVAMQEYLEMLPSWEEPEPQSD